MQEDMQEWEIADNELKINYLMTMKSISQLPVNEPTLMKKKQIPKRQM